jgi:hypothetical protein
VTTPANAPPIIAGTEMLEGDRAVLDVASSITDAEVSGEDEGDGLVIVVSCRWTSTVFNTNVAAGRLRVLSWELKVLMSQDVVLPPAIV